MRTRVLGDVRLNQGGFPMTRMIGRPRSPRRRFTLLAILGALIVAGLLATAGHAVFLTDSGQVDVQVPDKTTSKVDQTTSGGAFISYFGDSDTTFGSSGTGTFTPFVRLQGSPTEQGYNTDGTTQFDTKVGTWTHSIKVSQIPQRPCPQATGADLCFELFVDINESNTAKYVSLNKVDIWFTQNPSLSGYPFTASSTTTDQYTYSDSNGILIHDVNQGSGRGDLRYDIPVSKFDVPANCTYGNPACTTYFVLYSQWGSSNAAPDTKTYGSEGGFEEWKVKIYPLPPIVGITKTANPVGPVSAGSSIGFDINVTNTGPSAATGVTVSDPLPAGADLNWSLSPAFTGCSITGAAGAQTLNCSFATLAAGGTIGPIHITSGTTAADCATVSNTATVASGNDGGGSSLASVTVNCGALRILKESTKAGNPAVTKPGAAFCYSTATGCSTTNVTDNGAGDELSSTTGDVCVSGLAPGTYHVNETGAPPDYGASASGEQTVTVVSGRDCGSNLPSSSATGEAVFTDPPLSTITLGFHSLAGAGVTSATVQCTGEGSAANLPEGDATKTLGNGTSSLTPGTYTCTIVVDP